MLVLAGLLPGTGRGICWVVALAINYAGAWLGGLEGWRINPGHFAERQGLIITVLRRWRSAAASPSTCSQ